MALNQEKRETRSRRKPVLGRCPVAGSALGYYLSDYSFSFGGLLGHLNGFVVRASIDFVLRIGVISCKSEQVRLDLSGIQPAIDGFAEYNSLYGYMTNRRRFSLGNLVI